MALPLNRREFVLASASAALAGCAGTASGVTPNPPNATYDVIVVGGGAAGIGAARTVRSYGKSVLVLEAQDRLGGRARTDNTTFAEVPFDLGAQFFGHVRAGNVLYGIAQALGLSLVDFSTIPTYFYEGTAQASNASTSSFVVSAGGMIASLLAGGALIANDAEDYPVSAITDAFRGDQFYENAVGVTVLTETGVQPAASSTLDLFDFTQGSPVPFATPNDSFIFRSGMGNFIQGIASGLPVLLDQAVSRIAVDATGVTVSSSGGTFRGSTVIVAVSTGVLGAGAIEFRPALPRTVTDAIAALPLGVVYKAALGFKRNIFPFQGMTAVTPLSNAPAITYFANFWGTNVIEFLADADLAIQIEAMNRQGQIAYLLRRLESNVPGATQAFDGRFTASNWGSNPYTHGSYSHASVGMTSARTTLRAPVGNAIFFAGESVATSSSITLLQGAYDSGIGAATGALHALGVAVKKNGK
jgi:monoamine oxidase